MDYENMTVAELKDTCRNRGIRRYSKLKKADIIAKIKHGFIEVAIDNQVVVEDILTEVNNLTRNVSYDNVKEIAEKAESAIEHLPISVRPGCSLYLKCSLPNSYKYRATYTNVHMIRRKYAWFIERISRDYCDKKRYGGSSKIVICLSKAARIWLAKKSMEDMEVNL